MPGSNNPLLFTMIQHVKYNTQMSVILRRLYAIQYYEQLNVTDRATYD